MRGIVEIYSGDKLIHKEDNLIVDGASELLADIMTVSPSLSGMEHSTSSLLDTSNYMVQAISFGKGPEGYQQNAHSVISTYTSSISVGGGAIVVNDVPVKWAQLFLDGAQHKITRIITNEPYVSLTSSSYSPGPDLPTAPTPLDKKLENNTDLSAVYGTNVVLNEYSISSYIPSNGQNLNVLPKEYFSSIVSAAPDTILASALGYTLDYVTASLLGCYPEGSGVGNPSGTQYYIYSSLDNSPYSYLEPYGGNSMTDLSGKYESLFNSVSSMDTSGFVNMAASSWVDHRYSNTYGSNWYDPSYSGLIVSAYDGFSSVSGGGEVQYIITVSGSDLAGANLYGGIYNMGLWRIDVDKTLKAGNTAPFSFSPIYNPRKYKLFAKKSFSKNLCYIEDDVVSDPDSAGIYGYNDLRIVWRIRFL